MSIANQQIHRGRLRKAYSLAEVMVAVLISTLVLLSSICLFIMMLTAGETATSVGSTSEDAANAVQKIAAALRQARSFSMLDNTTYDATDTHGNIVAVTGLQITYPATASPTITIVKDSAGDTLTLSGANATYDHNNNGSTLTFYRSDTAGNPAPSNGSCLWMTGTDNGGPVNRAIVRTIALEDDAVQFVQPYKADGVTAIPNAVKISIVTSNNNGVAGTVSSHSSNGASTLLTSYQVYLRNHDPNGVSSAGAHGRTTLAN